MRLVFAGTPEVAARSLRVLLDSERHEVVAVVTRPDARTGRGRKVSRSPVAQLADEAEVPVLTPASPRNPEFVEAIRELGPDAAPIVAYGGLIPPELLDVPNHGWINLHFSLLPAWRGAAPVNASIAAGDEVTGATTFRLEEGLDTGPVYGTVTERIGLADTAGELLERLAESGAGLLHATLDGLETGELFPVPQSAEGVSYAPKLTTEDARVRWDLPGFVVDRHIRSVTPAPGAWAMFGEERIKIGGVGLAEDAPGDLRPGELAWTKTRLAAGTDAGAVELTRVQPPGKKMMDAMDWVRGARLEPGTVLT